jgi:hypothetical protein
MSEEQAEWTMNIADRYAARYICVDHHPLFNEVLSMQLVDLFPAAVQCEEDGPDADKNGCPETPPGDPVEAE